ncbi:MAG: hybrid sensor histidine kinase/response regulator [Desulfobacterales bacterium]
MDSFEKEIYGMDFKTHLESPDTIQYEIYQYNGEKNGAANNLSSNIMVVDDSETNLDLLGRILLDEGYAVAVFTDGKKALTFAKQNPPDIFLLDIMMPEASGYHICKILKEDPQTKDIPVIFISAKNDILDKVKAFSLGGVDYIPKPFQVDEVLARIKTHLEIRHLQKNLEKKNEELANTLEELKRTQHTLIRQEKLAALGQLIAGIAHEINTPLGAIQASAGNISHAIKSSIYQLPVLFQSLSPEQQKFFHRLVKQVVENRDNFSSRDARKHRKQIIEKLNNSGIGFAESIADFLVGMGIKNDIDNFLPLLASSECLKVLENANYLYVQHNNCENVKIASERAAKVVFALKSFVHFCDLNHMSRTHIKDSIEVVLTLYHNFLKKGIQVLTNYEDVPAIKCYPDELSQVWSNLIQNAIYAMQSKGVLEINLLNKKDGVCVQIIDSGAGIAENIKDRIFEPFYTTKPAGEGSGLGLDIVQKMVHRHGGYLTVESKPGRTVFSVFLPFEYSE